MKSIFMPLMCEGLTTLKIRYNWKKDEFRMEAIKEWESNHDFSKYNRDFYCDDILTENVQYLNTGQVSELYRKHGMYDYLLKILGEIKRGKHFGMVCYYNARNNIHLICHQHCRKMGINNRMQAIYVDGIRRYEPEDDEFQMISDGLNISRGMSYKLLVANLNFGGSKTMVQMPPLELNDMESMGFIAFAFDRNQCMTGADMKFPTELADIQNSRFSLNFTSGPNSQLGETGRPTAYGVYKSLKKAVLFKEGTESLRGKSIVLMGLGAVGWYMGENLLQDDVKLYIADVNINRIDAFIKAHPDRLIEAVGVDEALYMNVDIVSPCAVGNLIDAGNIGRLNCDYIWGSANNIIKAATVEEEMEVAYLMAEKGILFQPEWMYNTGGVICAAQEYKEGINVTYEKLIKYMDDNLPKATFRNLREAQAMGITPTENAYRLCNEIIFG